MRSAILVLMTIVLAVAQPVAAAPELSTADLERLHARFPEADANGDGTLTLDEAIQFRDSRNAKKKQAREPAAKPTGDALPVPTLADVAYGPHERNVLDFYRAASDKLTPVVIFFHGGGFRGGDKRSFAKDAGPYLDAGISVVSSNYRYSSQAIYPAPVLDGARAVQFVRMKAAEWNVDPAEIALSGSSAGGLMALWIALHDDLADATSDDAIARQSTRVACVVPYVAACSIEPEYVRRHLGATEFGAILPLFGVATVDELSRPDKAAHVHDASPLTHLSPDDPPILSIFRGPLTPTPIPPGAAFGQWIHHAKFGELLKEACEPLGVECTFHHAGDPSPEGEQVTFVLKQFAAAKSKNVSKATAPLNGSPPETIIYKSTADRDLRMVFDLPAEWKPGDRRGAIVFFVNGGWNPDGASRQFEDQARYFAARGLVVARADYREKSREGVTSTRCIEDTFSAIRWLRANAGHMGIDPERIAAAGGSGSIHLVAAGLFIDEIAAEGEDRSISPLPQALFLYHPDVDVLDPDVLVRMLDGESSEAMRRTIPPVVVAYGSRDVLAPYLDEIVARAKDAGLPFEKLVGDGGLHGFYKFSPWLETTTAAMDRRLVSLGFLAEEPRVELPQKPKPEDNDARILATQDRWTERHAQLVAEGRSGISRLAELPRVVALRQETHVYKTLGERRLMIIVHEPLAPADDGRRPAILFMEGGVMNPRDKEGNFYPLAKERARLGMPVVNRGPGEVFKPVADYFARRGLVAMRVEVRKRSNDGALPEDAIADGAAAVRWVRRNAERLGVDPVRIVVAGSSGGSHVAAAVEALDEYTVEPAAADGDTAGLDVSCRPDVLVLYSPLVDWLDPGPMGTRFLEALDGDRERAVRLSPARHWRDDMPPTLVLLGEREPIHDTVATFAKRWSEAGKPMQLFVAEGAGHAFASKSPWTERTTERVDEFLTRLGYLQAGPSLPLPHRDKPPKK